MLVYQRVTDASFEHVTDASSRWPSEKSPGPQLHRRRRSKRPRCLGCCCSIHAPLFAVNSLGAVRGLYCLYFVRHVLDPTIWMQGLYFKRVQILLPTMCRRKFTTSDRLCSYMWFSVKRWVFHFARYISVSCFSCFIPTLICEQTVVGAV